MCVCVLRVGSLGMCSVFYQVIALLGEIVAVHTEPVLNMHEHTGCYETTMRLTQPGNRSQNSSGLKTLIVADCSKVVSSMADQHTIITLEIIIYIGANYKRGAYMQQTLGSMAIPTVLATNTRRPRSQQYDKCLEYAILVEMGPICSYITCEISI